MNRSSTALPPVSGRVANQTEGIALLRAALTDPSVTAQSLAGTTKRVVHLMRHCRPEMYEDLEPLQAEFVLLLAAAKLTAYACDDMGDCVLSYRQRAEIEFSGYTTELDYEIAVLCGNALERIVVGRGYPNHTRRTRPDVQDIYLDVCLAESQHALMLKAVLDAATIEPMAKLALAS